MTNLAPLENDSAPSDADISGGESSKFENSTSSGSCSESVHREYQDSDSSEN